MERNFDVTESLEAKKIYSEGYRDGVNSIINEIIKQTEMQTQVSFQLIGAENKETGAEVKLKADEMLTLKGIFKRVSTPNS
jgi:hypothetical protein